MSKQNRSIYDYFRQQFAQVTNPPIDSLRENSVMSLEVCLGKERNIFEESSKHADRLILNSPVLDRQTFECIQDSKIKKYPVGYVNFKYAKSLDLEEAYHDAGQFYWGKAQAFKDELPIFSEKATPYILPRYLVQDIDTMEDLIRAEAMHRVLQETGLL